MSSLAGDAGYSQSPAQTVPAMPERDSRFLKCRLHSVPQNVVRIEGRTVRRSEDWPGYRVMVAVAAFTGLSRSEIRGLTWEAWQGDELHVLRSIVAGHVQDTKTRARKAPVPLLPSLAQVLAQCRAHNGNPVRMET